MKTGQQGYAAPLRAFGRTDVTVAGGKGANLGELVRQGFPVPDGFIVTTSAYGELVGSHGLNARILDLLSDGDDGARIRQEITKAPVPDAVRQAISDAYTELGGEPVAVRSSATAEDLPGAAFAGQQDTYLNIVGLEAVLEAVRQCWASLWTDRALAYRARQGIDPAEVRVAVVVQDMAPAEMAGVVFSANPVTGERDEVVIDASSGLGDAVVSGLVTPDHYVLGKRRAKLKQWQPGNREVVIRGTDGGGTTRTTGVATDQPALSKSVLRTLVRLAVAVEQHFDAPQDMEWAYVDGHVHLLQARPITALPPPPVHLHGIQKRTAPFFAEMLTMRPYPLDVTTWLDRGVLALVRPMATSVGVRFPTASELFLEQDGVVTRMRPPAPEPTLRVLAAPMRLARRARRFDTPEWDKDPRFAEFIRDVTAARGVDRSQQSWPELLRDLDETLAMPGRIGDLRVDYFPRAVLAGARLALLLRLIRRRDMLVSLVSGATTKTSETNENLTELAAVVRSDPHLRRKFAERTADELWRQLPSDPELADFGSHLAAFLDTYGHRETGSPLLVSQPTWSADPSIVIGLVQAVVDVEGGPAGSGHPEATRKELLAHPLLRFGPIRRRVQRDIERARTFLSAREDTHFYGTIPLPVVRTILVELGERLVHAGVLEEAMEVFHLNREELRSVPDVECLTPSRVQELRETVERRQRLRTELADVPLVDLSGLYAEPAADEDVLVTGAPSSQGSATGRVRLIGDASEFGRLQHGDVLVCHYTNPAWTPLFQRAAAVVVDTGGLGSHAAVTAREYGVPAVLGTGQATRKLTEGALVQVDGTLGRVTAVPEGDREQGDPGQGDRGQDEPAGVTRS